MGWQRWPMEPVRFPPSDDFADDIFIYLFLTVEKERND
jgi:hypothetical protein